MDELVAIARIARPHGLRGEVSADVLTDFPERFDGLESVIAVLPGDSRRELKIERFRYQNERILLKFAGLDRIEDSEFLRNAEICVTEGEAVELDEGEFFDWELSGCTVETLEGETVAIVKDCCGPVETEV